MRLFILLACLAAQAMDRNEDLHIKETGQFFVVRVVPGKKQTEFFIAGNKAAVLDFQKLQLKGRYYVNGQEKNFTLIRGKDSFTTQEPLANRQIELEIKESSEKVDLIKLNLKKH